MLVACSSTFEQSSDRFGNDRTSNYRSNNNATITTPSAMPSQFNGMAFTVTKKYISALGEPCAVILINQRTEKACFQITQQRWELVPSSANIGAL